MPTQPHRKLRPPRILKPALHHQRRDVAQKLKANQMDIDALHSALLSFTLLSGKLRTVGAKRPVNEWSRVDFGKFLNELDRDLRVAVAMLASELGFSVCQCCWPPEVLATDLSGQVKPLAGGDLAREIAPVFAEKNPRAKTRRVT